MAASEHVVKIDLLNDREFLQVIDLAVRMADASEAATRNPTEQNMRELEFHTHVFRNWFSNE